MGEFIKPKREYIADKQYIESLVNANLQKDLHGNEEICSYCHGTGLVIIDNPYGLSDDIDKRLGVFPYNHQSVTFCPHCFNGVVHRCEKCGEIIEQGFLKHNCKQQRELDKKEYIKKRKQALIDAPFAPPEVLKNSQFFYSDNYGYSDGYFAEWDEFFEYWRENGEIEGNEKPEFVWATEPVDMSIDAYDIISNATEDLYEGAIDNISDAKIKELQDFLDSWCKTCGVGSTYYESKYKVKIPWEDYK